MRSPIVIMPAPSYARADRPAPDRNPSHAVISYSGRFGLAGSDPFDYIRDRGRDVGLIARERETGRGAAAGRSPTSGSGPTGGRRRVQCHPRPLDANGRREVIRW